MPRLQGSGEPTREELIVLREVAMGGQRTKLTDTERSRLSRLYLKLGADSAPHAVFLAIQLGYLSPINAAIRIDPRPPVALGEVGTAGAIQHG